MVRTRKAGTKYKKSLAKVKARITLLEKLCRANYKIDNKTLMQKLGISKTEFYRNYKAAADLYRANNKKEALF
ncbi:MULTISPECIES: hypothetical protein [Fusobacterium]|jgi:hypothetical protein|uniref:hypothetical protein n=1 Tax=Fusobacterium TaxID=848 RepID=UPI000E88E611|nr:MULTISPECIES: hypothetical protein [Fusobacterium]HBJ80218.1 hypothetical protein [Fusobacterium sp.]